MCRRGKSLFGIYVSCTILAGGEETTLGLGNCRWGKFLQKITFLAHFVPITIIALKSEIQTETAR